MCFFIFAAVLTNFVVSVAIFYKLRKLHVKSFRIEENSFDSLATYSQIQAYLDLVSLIQPRRPLPQLRGWAASPDFLKILATLTLEQKPKVVLECSSGASTIVLARCCELSKSGHVFSLEHDPIYAEKTRALLRAHSLDSWATVIDAPLVPYEELDGQPWYSIEALDLANNSVDLLVVDGPPLPTAPLARYPAIPLLIQKLANRCVVMLDDADRAPESAAVEKWLTDFPDFQLTRLPAEKGCARLDLLAQKHGRQY